MAARMRIIIPATLLLIVVLLFLHFRNLIEVLIVLLSVPFALAGSVWLLWLLDYRFSTAVWVGVIALVGLAAQTGIVMIVYIDNAYESSRGFMTFLRMVPGTSPLEVWFSDLAGTGADPYPPGYVKLDLTFTQYVETLLLTKGLHGWQYLFADVSLTDPALQHVAEGLRNGVNALPDIFPGLDYTPLIQRLKTRS